MAENFHEKFMEDSSDFKNMIDFFGGTLGRILEIIFGDLRRISEKIHVFFLGEFLKICLT